MTSTVPVQCDTLVQAAYLLPMKKGAFEVLKDHAVAIEGSKIIWIGPQHEASRIRAKKTISATKHAVLPGLINAHTHMAMSLFRGLADDLPFQEWLHKYILPLEGNALDKNFVRLGAQLAAAESLQFGTTTLVDMYYFQEETCRVLDENGLRGLVGENTADFPAPDDKQKQNINYQILDRMVEKYGRHERIHPMVAPHAPYTCSDETLRVAVAYAKKHQLPLTIHVSETAFEVEESQKQFACSPVERLYKLGLMQETKSIFAHCVHLSEQDIQLMAQTKTGAIYNPESNMKLGAGVAKIPQMLAAGVRVGIGTDGAASNNALNLFSEMDTGAKLQKLAHSNNAIISAVQMLELATIRGAEAIHMDQNIGSLELGKYADIIAVNLEHAHMQPVHEVAAQLVYAATGSEVDHVIVHGELLLENKKSLRMDIPALLSEVKNYKEHLKRVLGSVRP